MQGNSAPRIVPRVVVEMLPHQYTEMLTSLKADVIKVLVEECKRNKLDGMVSGRFLYEDCCTGQFQNRNLACLHCVMSLNISMPCLFAHGIMHQCRCWRCGLSGMPWIW